jgi:hypothetical protein
MAKSCTLQAFVIIILITGIVTSVQNFGTMLLPFVNVNAQQGIMISVSDGTVTSDPRPADGRTYYIQKDEDTVFTFTITTDEPNAELSYIGMDRLAYLELDPLPAGFTVTQLDEITMRILVDPRKIEIPDEGLPANYAIIFNSTQPSDNPSEMLYAETVFAIERSDSRPSPSITFDKSTYSLEDNTLNAIVTLIDPHLDCNYKDPDADNDSGILVVDDDHPSLVNIRVWFDGEPENNGRGPIPLSRDGIGSIPFRGPISVTVDGEPRQLLDVQRSLKMHVKYDPSEFETRDQDNLCILPQNEREMDAIEVNAIVTEAGVSFDKPTYSRNDVLGDTDMGTITVVDPNAPDGTVLVTLISELGAVSIDLSENPAGSNTFSKDISFTTTQVTDLLTDPVQLNVASGSPIDLRTITLKAVYQVQPPVGDEPPINAETTVNVIPERKLSFDDDRLSYKANELATLVLKDPNANEDPNEYENPNAITCSYSYPSSPSGNYQFLHRSIIEMAESERNSGEFVSSYFLKFTNNTYDGEDLDDYDLDPILNATLIEELRRNAVLISEDGLTLLYATMNEEQCMDSLNSLDEIQSNILRPIATVEPAVLVTSVFGGTGGSDTSTVHENPPLYSVNVVACGQYDYGPDSDGDGACDGWETATGLNIPYAAGGTRYALSNTCCPDSTIPDVYVEIDYVDNIGACTGTNLPYNVSYRPDDLAISNVLDAFAEYGVQLHIQVGEDVGGSGCRTTINTWGDADGGSNSFDEMKRYFFGFTSPYSERITTNRGMAKFQVFHYGIFGPRQTSDLGSSGMGELTGNDFIVTLGSSSFQYNSVDQQQGTLMHELGHNLGLYHGGSDDGVNDNTVNCKPNYPSVMSYIRQYTNAYDNATLRYSDDTFLTSNAVDNRRISSTDPREDNIMMLTSSSALSSVEIVWGILDGTNWVAVDNDLEVGDPTVKADVGRGPDWSDIDWDHNDVIDDSTTPPGDSIIRLGITGCNTADDGVIYGSDDWDNLLYDFRNLNPTAFSSGFGQPESYPTEMTNITNVEIRLAGIQYLNYSINHLPDTAFKIPEGSGAEAQQIKDEYEDKLLVGTNSGTHVIENVNSSSVASLIATNDLKEAIDKLLALRVYVDAVDGGNKTNDLFVFEDLHPELEIDIDFSRTVLPIPPEPGSDSEIVLNSSKAITTLIITDPKKNNQSGTEEAISFTFEDDVTEGEPSFRVEIDGQGSGNDETISSAADYADSVLEDILQGLNSMIIEETGGSSGVFDEELEFEFGSLDLDEWQGLEVSITYIDANGEEVRDSISFKGNDGIVSADQTTITNGTILTITVQDEDLNLDDDEMEEFNSSVGTNGTFLLSVQTDDDEVVGTTTEEFRETGEDTSIFTATFEVGQDIPISGNNTQATKIVITYNDEVDFNGGEGGERKIIIPIVSGTGLIKVTPDLAGPSTKLTVLITDTDLDEDPASIDSYDPPVDPDDDFIVEFNSDRNEVGDARPIIEETGPNTGVFQFSILLLTDEDACEDDDLDDPSFEATGGADPSIGACPGDLIAIRYEDEQDAEGQQITVSSVIEVMSWDPEFTADKSEYDVGDNITITIKDQDANRDPDIADSLTDIGVASDSDPVGEEFSALETGPNTGVFRFEFATSSSTQSGSVHVVQGDDVTIEYTDDFPADFEDVGEDKDFTFSVAIGTIGGGMGGGVVGGGMGGGNGKGPSDSDSQAADLAEVKNVLRILDNNIASLKVAINLPFEQHSPFEITSLDLDCDEDDDENEGCTITGYSDTVTSVANTFHINSETNTMTWDFIGQGIVELHIPAKLTPYVDDVRTVRGGGQFTHTSATANATTTVVIEDLTYYPRLLAVGYEETDLDDYQFEFPDSEVMVCSSVITIAPCFDDVDINPGDNIIVMTPIRNAIDATVPCTAVTQVRDPQGLTIALYWTPCTTSPRGSIGPNGSAVISTDLKLYDPGTYTVVTIILDDLDRQRAVLGYHEHAFDVI